MGAGIPANGSHQKEDAPTNRIVTQSILWYSFADNFFRAIYDGRFKMVTVENRIYAMNNSFTRRCNVLRFRTAAATALLTTILCAGCETSSTPKSGAASTSTQEAISDSGKSIVLLSVTSDAKQSPQAVDMAMKLAGFSLDEGRQVVMFFQVKGVTCPTKSFPDEFAFQENDTIKSQLQQLIERGVDVHVCPICMKGLGVQAEDLIEGAKVTTRPSLFENIGANTAVFTY